MERWVLRLHDRRHRPGEVESDWVFAEHGRFYLHAVAAHGPGSGHAGNVRGAMIGVLTRAQASVGHQRSAPRFGGLWFVFAHSVPSGGSCLRGPRNPHPLCGC